MPPPLIPSQHGGHAAGRCPSRGRQLHRRSTTRNRGSRQLQITKCLTSDTVWVVNEVTIRELRNHGGEVLERVERGEVLTVTRAGVPVGELRPLQRPRVTASTLLARWRSVPAVELAAFRADVDAVLDPSL